MNLSENAIDKDALLKRCMGATDFAQSIVNQFLGNWERDYRKLESCIDQAIHAHTSTELVLETHRLKGTAATIGANVLAEQFNEMEAIAVSEDVSKLHEKLEHIQREIERISDFAAENL